MTRPNFPEKLEGWLRARSYDGLWSPAGECACLLADLAPCGQEELSECKPGYRSDCGEWCGFGCDFHIGPHKPEKRVVTVEIHSQPDDKGRQKFTIGWAGNRGRRAQLFNAVLAEILRLLEGDNCEVVYGEVQATASTCIRGATEVR
jgi:hypothetical protein